jgi:hypothetical protein
VRHLERIGFRRDAYERQPGAAVYWLRHDRLQGTAVLAHLRKLAPSTSASSLFDSPALSIRGRSPGGTFSLIHHPAGSAVLRLHRRGDAGAQDRAGRDVEKSRRDPELDATRQRADRSHFLDPSVTKAWPSKVGGASLPKPGGVPAVTSGATMPFGAKKKKIKGLGTPARPARPPAPRAASAPRSPTASSAKVGGGGAAGSSVTLKARA